MDKLFRYLLLGEQSPVTLVMYTLDFILSLIVLWLFKMYAKKSTHDEERLKRYYFLCLNQQGACDDLIVEETEMESPQFQRKQVGCNGLAALAKNYRGGELDADSFIK
jgi:hypothetical protein